MQRTDDGGPIDQDRLCEALTKSGRPCQGSPVVGHRLCEHHGGPAPGKRGVRLQQLRSPAAFDAVRDLNDRLARHRVRDAIKEAIEHGVDPDYIEKCIEKYRKPGGFTCSAGHRPAIGTAADARRDSVAGADGRASAH